LTFSLKAFNIIRNFMPANSSILNEELNNDELLKVVKAAKVGDKDALTRLFKYLYPKVYRYIFYRVERKEDAEDLTGAVILKILKNLPGQKKNFKHWVYRIASNMVIDFYRRQGVRKEVKIDDLEEDIPDEREVKQENVEWLNPSILKKAMCCLTREQAEVINLRFIQGYSNEEVSRIMGKRVGAVKALQFRALQALREYFRKKGYEIKD